MSLPTVEAVTEALANDEVMPVPDGATVGSLGEDAVLMPETQWRILQQAARAYVNATEFDAPHTVDVPGHYLLIKVRSE